MASSDTTSQSLPTALLLAASGGLLDAVIYLVHHGVFASALSGNVVLLGLDLCHRNVVQATRHLIPIAATLAGVFVARAIRIDPPARVITLSVLFESALLLVCGLITHHVPGSVIVVLAAFAGALQISNFRRVDNFAYNSTFVTGNLRDFAEGCFEAIDHAQQANAGTRQRGRRKLRDLSLITIAFLLGVAFGAALTPAFQDRALWAAIPLVLAVLLLRTSTTNAKRG